MSDRQKYRTTRERLSVAYAYIADVVVIGIISLVGQGCAAGLLPEMSLNVRIPLSCWGIPLPVALFYFWLRGRRGANLLIHSLVVGLLIAFAFWNFVVWAFSKMA